MIQGYDLQKTMDFGPKNARDFAGTCSLASSRRVSTPSNWGDRASHWQRTDQSRHSRGGQSPGVKPMAFGCGCCRHALGERMWSMCFFGEVLEMGLGIPCFWFTWFTFRIWQLGILLGTSSTSTHWSSCGSEINHDQHVHWRLLMKLIHDQPHIFLMFGCGKPLELDGLDARPVSNLLITSSAFLFPTLQWGFLFICWVHHGTSISPIESVIPIHMSCVVTFPCLLKFLLSPVWFSLPKSSNSKRFSQNWWRTLTTIPKHDEVLRFFKGSSWFLKT